MENLSGFKHRSKLATQITGALTSARTRLGTAHREVRIGKEHGLLWPLFLSTDRDATEGYEIDTCATALGFSATLSLQKESHKPNDALTTRSLLTLLSLRRDDGSWPSSQVRPGAGPPAAMEGVVNDTIFALQAVIDSGFFDTQSEHALIDLPAQYANLNTMSSRFAWLKTTIDWINRNKVDKGWYYTSTEFMTNRMQFRPAIAPTAAMTIVLSRVCQLGRQSSAFDVTVASRMRDDAIQLIIDTQHESGGFGRDNQDIPRVAHTAACLQALASVQDRKTLIPINRAIDWLLAHSSRRKIIRSRNADCFDEYEQAIVRRGHAYSKRVIAHENPVEPFILRALATVLLSDRELNIGLVRKRRIQARVFSIVNLLLERQEKDGKYRGAFRSRRNVDSERFTVYWIYHSAMSLLEIQRLVESGQLSQMRLFASSVFFRVLLIFFAVGFYWKFQSNDIKLIAGIMLTAVAANLLTMLITRD